MIDSVRLSSSPIIWTCLFCLIALGNGVTGIDDPTLNVDAEWVLYSTESNPQPLEITCRGRKELQWEIMEDITDDLYEITKDFNTTTEDYASTFRLWDPFAQDTGNYTCKYKTGEKVTTYVYIFDNGTGFVYGSVHLQKIILIGQDIILDCRTTHPDITVTVHKNGNEVTSSFEVDDYYIFKKEVKSVQESGVYTCQGTAINFEDNKSWVLTIEHEIRLPKPSIEEDYNTHHLVGQNLTLICKLPIENGEKNKKFLIWNCPNIHADRSTAPSYVEGNNLVSQLIVKNTSLADSGIYNCTARHGAASKFIGKSIIFKKTIDPFVTMKNSLSGFKSVNILEDTTFLWILSFKAYPEEGLVYSFYGPSRKQLINETDKVSIFFNYKKGNATLKIDNIGAQDFGEYSFVLTNMNGIFDNSSLFAIIHSIPKVAITNLPETFPANIPIQLEASILSFNNNSTPIVSWSFTDNCYGGYGTCENELGNELTQVDTRTLPNGFGLTNKYFSHVQFQPENSGKIRCEVSNGRGRNYTEKYIILSDIIGGTFQFSLTLEGNLHSSSEEEQIVMIEGDQDFKMKCAAVKFVYKNIKLIKLGQDISMINCSSKWSDGYCIEKSEATMDMEGQYNCSCEDKETGKNLENSFNIKVKPLVKPHLLTGSNVSSEGTTITLEEYKQFNISCLVEGTPIPTITWFKDDKNIETTDLLKNNKDGVLLSNNRQTLEFKLPHKAHEGKYSCEAKSRAGSLYAKTFVEIETGINTIALTAIIVSIIIVVCLLSFIIYLVLKVKKEKEFRRELRRNRMYLFENGNMCNINPDCTVDEQADLLPYDNRYEVKKDNIKLGKLLGCGAFGRVMEAKVQDLETFSKYSRAAVKMCKDETDKSQLQALTLELKIMIHMGKNLNIVNLMGAMTVNLDKGELWILVEYCRYGNMLRFLHKNKACFMNQIDPETGTIDSNRMSPLPMDPRTSLGRNSYGSRYSSVKSGRQQGRLNSVSSNPDTTSGSTSRPGYYAGNSNYITAAFSQNSSQNSPTDIIPSPTLTNSSNHYVTASQFNPSSSSSSPTKLNRSDSTISSDESYHRTLATDMTVLGSQVPLSPSSEAGEFSFDIGDTEWIPGISGPITTTDLICWSWQMATGMEYLAKRKVLHGDLAARNLLLAENNVIKISDFGLSRDMYKNDNYMKKSDGNLPVKWMSPEAIQQRIFSTQSDVWAFGITMWELFTLGNTPYPGIPLDPNFTRRLESGERMEKPKFADEQVYNIMLHCWKADPLDRPYFSELSDTLASMLALDRTQDYVAMNTVLKDKNAEFMGSMEDYFNLMSSPDFGNVQPSEDKLDGGYMKMQEIMAEGVHPPTGYVSMNVVTSSPPSSASLFSPRPSHPELENGTNFFNFTENSVSSSRDKVSPVETSKLLEKVQEAQEEQKADIEKLKLLDESTGPTTPTSFEMANNNNTEEISYPEYKNIDLVSTKNLSKASSIDLPSIKDEVIAEINADHSDVIYINIKNIEDSNNYINIPTSQDESFMKTNIV